MLLTKKQKKILNLSLLISLIVIIVVSMVVGVYFIFKLGKDNMLTKEQRDFGDAISSSKIKSSRNELDSSILPKDMSADEVVFYTENYLVTANEQKVYYIYSRQKGDYIHLQSQFDSVQQISGNVGLFYTQNGKILVDLLTGNTLSNLANAVAEFAGDYVFVYSKNNGEVSYVPGGIEKNPLAFVVNTKTLDCVYSVGRENIISLNLCGKYFVETTTQKTNIYSLSDFKIIKSFENKVGNGFTLESNLSGESFSQQTLYSLSYLGGSYFLAEKAELGNENDYTIEADVKYKLSYGIFDANKNLWLEIDNSDCVLRTVETGINHYYAFAKYQIENKQKVSDNLAEIVYFSLSSGKKGVEYKEVVSYDYSMGKVVGFNSGKLILTGGANSAEIDFDGNASQIVDTLNGQRVVSSNFDGAIVVSSLIGQKKIVSGDGKDLFSEKFIRVSPFENGYSVAYDGVDYYILSSKGDKKKVNLAPEFVDYAFMGMGMYILQGKNGYDVFSLDGKRLYKADHISVTLQDSKTLLINISGEKDVLLKVGTILPYDSSVYKNEQIEIAPSGQIKNAISALAEGVADELEDPTISVDSISGIGKAVFTLNLNFDELDYTKYEQLTDGQKALLPRFDNGTQYYGAGQTTSAYNVFGAHFFTKGDVTIAVVRLERNDLVQYFIVIAVNNAYFVRVSSNVNALNFEDGKTELPLEFEEMLPSKGLVGRAGLFEEENDTFAKNRTVNFASAGFDGGLTLTIEDVHSAQISFVLQNAFASMRESENLTIADTDGSYGKFDVSVNTLENKINVNAVDGYLITSMDIVYYNDGLYGSLEEVDRVSVNEVFKSGSFELVDKGYKYVAIKNVVIVESYNILRLVEFDDSIIEDIYCFYGYGSDVSASRNSAWFGFDNFFRRESVKVLSRVGYTFDGYQSRDSKELIINDEGAIVQEKADFISAEGGKVFVLDASYTAKQYTIHYDSNNQPLVSSQAKTTVTFDQEVGPLFDIVNSEYNREGYDFLGWWTQNSRGEFETEYNSHTLYTQDRDITLYAKWQAKQYTITLHSNIDTYTNNDVSGYTYNIDTILKDGEAFSEEQMTVTYNALYGRLPTLSAQNSEKPAEEYVFVGWYDQSGFNVLDDGQIEYLGQQITSTSAVSANPSLDLYAQFKRNVVSGRVVVNGYKDAGNQNEIISSYIYEGTNQYGKKGEFTLGQNGFEAEEQNSQTSFRIYGLQNETLSNTFVLGEGYYFGKITITLAEGEVFSIVGEFNPETKEVTYTSITNEKVVVSAEDGSVNIQLLNLENTQNLLIEYQVETKKFYLDFSLSNGDDGALICQINDGTPTYQHYLGYQTNYKNQKDIAVFFAGVVNGNARPSNKILKSISILGNTIEFSSKFERVNDKLMLNLSSETKHTSVWQENNRIDTYAINSDLSSVQIEVIYDGASAVYYMIIHVTSAENITANLTFENIERTASASTKSLYEADENGIDIFAEKNGEGVDGAEQTILPSDKLVYTIAPKDGNFISELNISIDGNSWSLASPTLDFAGADITALPNYIASDLVARTDGTKLYINGTGIVIEWNASTRGFIITMENTTANISFEVVYSSYTLVNISEKHDSVNYKLTLEGEGAYQGDVSGILSALPEQGRFVQGIYNKEDSYLFVGLKNSITQISLALENTNEVMQRISLIEYSSGEGYAEVSPNGLLITISSEAKAVTIVLKINVGGMSLSSFIQYGESEYTNEKEEETARTKLFFQYYNGTGELQSYNFSANLDGVVSFYGSVFSLQIYDIVGYKLEKVNLVFAGQNPITLEQTSSGSDDNGNYKIFSANLNDYDFADGDITFEVYHKAIEYDVVYDPSNDEGSETKGETLNSHHVFNRFSELSENGFSKQGYTFVGWSKEPVSGPDLTEEDVDIFPGILSENLSSEDGAEVTLYAVFKADAWFVNYNYNDSEAGNGSSSSTASQTRKQVSFDHALGELFIPEREGYLFVNWASKKEDGSVIDAQTMLSSDLLNIVENENKTITIYAIWSKISLTLVLHKNDSSEPEGFGSSPAEGEQEQLVINYDEEFSSLLPLSRVGYIFLGYKGVRLGQDEYLTDTHAFIGYGENCKNIINASSKEYGIEVDNRAPFIHLYAVYQAEVFRAYVNINNKDLLTYQQPDGAFLVSMEGHEPMTSAVPYLNFYFEVTFDHQFGTLPSIKTVAYDFVGFYLAQGNGTVIPSDEQIINSTIFSYEKFNSAQYSSSTDELTSLGELYALGEKNFSLFAYYKNGSYGITFVQTEQDPSKYALQKVDDYLSYSPSSLISASDSLNGTLSCLYGDDIVLDIIPSEGRYISRLEISYTDNFGNNRTIVITFEWSNTLNVSVLVDGSPLETNYNEYLPVLDKTQYIVDGIKLMMLPYNKDGEDETNIAKSAIRLVLAFDYVKTNFRVGVISAIQTYDVTYYSFFKNTPSETTAPSLEPRVRTFEYGSTFDKDKLSYVWVQMFGFEKYYYGRLGDAGEVVDPEADGADAVKIGDVIKNNLVLVGVYTFSSRQAVNFYDWNRNTNSYKLRQETSECYVLGSFDGENWKLGEYEGVYYSLSGENSGRLLVLPNPSNEPWPEGYYFAGYVIADSASSGFYTKADITDLQMLTTSTIIDGEINAYAVYGEQIFTFTMQESEGSLLAKPELEMFELLSDGGMYEYTSSDVFILGLTEGQVALFIEELSNPSQSIATALRKALQGYDITGAYNFSTDSAEPVEVVNNGYAMFICFTVRYNPDGIPYISEVSDNCYRYNDGHLTSLMINDLI